MKDVKLKAGLPNKFDAIVGRTAFGPSDRVVYVGHPTKQDAILRRAVLAPTITVGAGGPQTFVYIASGGIVFAGSALYAKVKNFIASGGITFGGVAGVAKSKAFVASGGIVFGGSAETSYLPAAPAVVPLIGGGIAISQPRKRAPLLFRYMADGGLTFGGSAITRFIPAAVVHEEAATIARTIDRDRHVTDQWEAALAAAFAKIDADDEAAVLAIGEDDPALIGMMQEGD